MALNPKKVRGRRGYQPPAHHRRVLAEHSKVSIGQFSLHNFHDVTQRCDGALVLHAVRKYYGTMGLWDSKGWQSTTKGDRAKAKGAWVLDPGNRWNPLTRFPRNHVCWCGSGVKFKKCCIDKLARYVEAKHWRGLRDIVRAAGR